MVERSSNPDRTRKARPFSWERSAPQAISALSCGHTDPLWYDIGLYRLSPSATVRIPQPDQDSGASSVLHTLRCCASGAMPEKRQCPAFELRTSQGCFSPSSASA